MAPERADLVARLAGGRLDRARALDGRLAGRARRVRRPPPAHSTDRGARSRPTSPAVQAAMQDAMAELDAAQAEEDGEPHRSSSSKPGYPDRVARAQLRRLGDQQKRAHRHARTELLLEGITALETVYRDALAGPGAPALNVDRPMLVVDARAAAAALDACRAARQVLIEHNPNETLLLERLLLHLPAAR